MNVGRAPLEFFTKTAMVAILVLIVVGSPSFLWWNYAQGERDLVAEMSTVAADNAAHVDKWLARQQTELLQPTDSFLPTVLREMRQPQVRPERRASYLEGLEILQRRNPETVQIELFDTEGRRLLALRDGGSGAFHPTAEKLTALQKNPALAFSEDCRLPADGECFAVIASLFETGAQGKTHVGYAVFSLDLRQVLAIFVGEWSGLGRKAKVGLLRANRFIGVDRGAVGSPEPNESDAGVMAALSAKAGSQFFTTVVIGGQDTFAAVHPVKGARWSVAVLADREVALRGLRQRIWRLVFFEAALLLCLGVFVRNWQVLRTARLRLQDKQREQQFLQDFIDHIPGIAYVKDANGNVLLANSGFDRQLGMTAADMIGRNCRELFPGEFGEKIDRDDRRIFDSGQAETYVEEFADRIFETSKFVMIDRDGKPLLGGITFDITQRIRTLRRIEALNRLSELATAGNEGQLLAAGLEMARSLTGSRAAYLFFVSDNQQSLIAAANAAGVGDRLAAAPCPLDSGVWADCVRQRQPLLANDCLVPGAGATLQRLLCLPVVENERVRLLLGVGDKDSDYQDSDVETVQLLAKEIWLYVCRGRVEAALRMANQVIEKSPIVAFRWRAEPGWPMDYVSENIARWGYRAEDLLSGKLPFADLIHPDDQARIAAEVNSYTAAGRCDYVQEYRLLTADGRVIWVEDVTGVERDAAGKALAYNGLLADISERKAMQSSLAEQMDALRCLNKRLEEAQAQLLQSEKLAAIGQLAAGVAHELNNPISFAHSNLGTLAEYVRTLVAIADICPDAVDSTEAASQFQDIRRIKEDEDYRFIRQDIFPLLDETRDGLQRVRKIVQDLRDFSRSGSQDWAWADLHSGIESTLNIVRNELKYKCTVIKEFGEIPEVYCVLSQLNQVFMNLLVNAAQAIEEKGEIVLRTGVEDEAHVWISVSDTGSGISPENLRRIFEPFFTTKAVGKGTGLGLSLVYGIIERHGGKISVDSEVGRGTTFRIVLPVRPPQSSGAPVEKTE